jgi:predicted O-methyltransferase YrrM
MLAESAGNRSQIRRSRSRKSEAPFDLVFLDADRASYATYLDLALPKLVPGGLLVADNVVSHAAELEDYVGRVKSHPELFSVTVPVGNGEEISYKLA